MRSRSMFFSAVLLSLSCGLTHAVVDVEGSNEFTIKLSDIPADAPSFSAYAARPYAGRNAPLVLGKDKQALLFKTRLREGSRQKVNFAGHAGLPAVYHQALKKAVRSRPEMLSAIAWNAAVRRPVICPPP